ncbi:MAG: CoA transferase subunit A [Armatimonadetes bacterium]|nr:CoA transferase subunit A [Armatimonadota bacterium]
MSDAAEAAIRERVGRKVMTLRDAVARFVPDGASVAMGCALESCIPFAAGYEMIRQRRRDLTLIGPISDMLFDVLIGAGCVRRVVAAWVGNVAAGLAHNLRRALEDGVPAPVEMVDHSNLTLALGLQAAAMGVPFLPTRTALGTDLMPAPPSGSAHGGPHESHRDLHGNRRDDQAGADRPLASITCPFTGERLAAVAAIHPDVAVVHAQRADREGNAHLWGNLGVVAEAARAARAVIITCEEIVEPDVIRNDPNRTVIPGFLVSAVVHLPGGAHPSPVQGYWRRDDAFFFDYHRQTRPQDGNDAWLRDWVLSLPDHAAYMAWLGTDRVARLRITGARPAALVSYGW